MFLHSRLNIVLLWVDLYHAILLNTISDQDTVTALMQLLVLATFDKNLNILSLFDFHHIFLSYQCCSKHHKLTADLKTLPFVLAHIFLITYFCRNVFPRPHYPAEISLPQLSFSERIDSKYYPFSKFDVI